MPTEALLAAKEIDRLCDELEASRRRGDTTPIEEFLAKRSVASERELLVELAVVEVELCLSSGAAADVDGLLHRFPQYAEELQQRLCPSEASDTFNRAVVSHHLVDALPLTLGHFQALEVAGSGTFGTVWKAEDTRLGRFVAIKVARSASPDAAALMINEGRLVAALKHPNIVPIHDTGSTASFIFIVSDYINGSSLKQRLTAGTYTEEHAASLVLQICKAVAHAHSRGIVHCDIKPANVLIDLDGIPYLTDFGLAYVADADNGSREFLRGTPAYMAPEQVRADRDLPDHRSDLYSLGAVLFEMVEGRPLYVGSIAQVLEHLRRGAESPRFSDRWRSPVLLHICRKCLASDVASRYQTADELAADLTALLDGRRPPHLDIPRSLQTRLWVTRRRWLLSASGLSAVAAGTTAILTYRSMTKAPETRVLFETSPPLCAITVVPIDSTTGMEDGDGIQVLPGRTPLWTYLLPGDYLVVAVAEDGTFHEVLRRVPKQGTRPNEILAHRHWTVVSGGTALTPIVIPGLTMPREPFRRVPEGETVFGKERWYSPAVDVSLSKLSVDLRKRLQLSDARVGVSKDKTSLLTAFPYALSLAEKLGARLPSIIELERLAGFVAANRETSDWSGINDGVCEWSTTRAGFSGTPAFYRTAPAEYLAVCRLVGNCPPPAKNDSPRLQLQQENLPNGEVGIRIVRSVAPRTTLTAFPEQLSDGLHSAREQRL